MSTATTVDTQGTKKPAKKPEKKLTYRERKTLKYLAQGMTQKDALIKAGYSPITADKAAKDILGKPRVQSAMERAMVKAGIDDDSLADKIKQGLECKKVISATVIHKDNNGKTEQIDDFIEVPDNPTQHRYVDTALKLKGAFPDPKIDLTVPLAIQVNVVSYGDKGAKE